MHIFIENTHTLLNKIHFKPKKPGMVCASQCCASKQPAKEIIIPLLIVSILNVVCCNDALDSWDALFTSKKLYDPPRNHIGPFEECNARRIWMLMSYGAHYPQSNIMGLYSRFDVMSSLIVENYVKYHSSELSEGDIEAFEQWEFGLNTTQSNTLTDIGYEELAEIGNRLYTSFPNLFDPKNIYINITSTELSKASAEAFVAGIIGAKLEITKDMINDELLMNEKNCTVWENIMKNNTYMREQIKELKNYYLSKFLMNMIIRLGFIRELPYFILYSTYSLCLYESSWSPSESSPWCNIYKNKEVALMEYLKDIIYYYHSGYGNPYAIDLGCFLLRDLLDNLSIDGTGVTLRFADDTQIRKLLVTLGIAGKDAPLKGKNFDKATKRQWKTNTLIPYSANIYAVLYECEEGFGGVKNKLRVVFYLNEKIVELPICGDTMCDYIQFASVFEMMTDPTYCNRDFCETLKK